MTKKNLLVLLPQTNGNQSIGGTTLLSELFLQELSDSKVDFDLIQTNYYNSKLVNFIRLFLLLFSKTLLFRYKTVIISCSDNLQVFFLPFAYLVCKFFKSKLIIRTFGGNLVDNFEAFSSFNKRIQLKIFRSAFLVTAETINIYDYFKSHDIDAYWFPNVRKKNAIQKKHKKGSVKYFFVGSTIIEKGIAEILEVNNYFGYSKIDIYGPTPDEYILNLDYHNSFKGIIKPDLLVKKILEYDVLVLPTFWYGEGYPGIILEAMSVGVPVITTKFQSLTEFLVHNENALLVDIKNSDQIIEAIIHLDNDFEHLKYLSKNSTKTFNKRFVSKDVHKKFFKSFNPIFFK